VLCVSVLFNEPKLLKFRSAASPSAASARSFSALQRAEIAEIARRAPKRDLDRKVSVLFNEPKLLKLNFWSGRTFPNQMFQCSSTSRNC